MMETVHLEIRRPGHDPQRFSLLQGVYTIGSDNECKIQLAHPLVDARHAILTIREDELWIDDLGSTQGTILAGNAISGRERVEWDQTIDIGCFTLCLHSSAQPSAPPAGPAPAAEPPPTKASATPPTSSHATVDQKRSIKAQIHDELVERLDLKRLTATRIDQEELYERARATIETIVHDVADRLPPGIREEDLVKEICDEALRLGPLEDFLQDESVSEIMVNGHNQIYVERNGKIELTDTAFMNDTSVLAIIERIVSPIGRRIDESQPYVDARLPDGSRVNAIIHPLSLSGPCLTIRKFSKVPFTDRDLVRLGTLTDDATSLLDVCVRLRKNIIVSGGTGSGKTTLLNVLSGYLPAADRIVTIEDAAELRLTQSHVVRLEARPPNIEGRGAIPIRDLVRNALRMRPDRIVVGECRGGEALDMLQAMNTGHDGSLTTVHANSPRDVISRLETMVLMSGMDLPIRAIREQVASAIDLIVHESRLSDGSRKVTRITEVMGLEGDQITMQDLFEFKQTGIGEDGSVQGIFAPTGSVPSFLEDMKARGMSLDHAIFSPGSQ